MTEAILTRIRALQSKTTDRGCTEQEALSAARKVAELLDRHGLTEAELTRQENPCIRQDLRTGRARPGPYDACGPYVAAYFDVRTWLEHDAEGTLHHVFYGLPPDVEAAIYLMHLIAHAFETEANLFRNGPGYLKGRGNGRRILHTSFMLGLSRGICTKLDTMLAERNQTRAASQSLIVAKSHVIEAGLSKLGIRFRTRSAAPRRVNSEAFTRGETAGTQFNIKPGLSSPSPSGRGPG